jgi:hypothetical protein
LGLVSGLAEEEGGWATESMPFPSVEEAVTVSGEDSVVPFSPPLGGCA